MLDRTGDPVVTRRGSVALAATLAVALTCWAVAVHEMSGMNDGVATRLGSFGFFIGMWVPMMAAMMLPGVAPTVLRRAHRDDGMAGQVMFVAGYLAVWTVAGVAVYWLYRPHGAVAAGVVVIAAGLYELTPVKTRCRQRCRETVRTGAFALCCLGSSAGLMAVLVVVGVMSVAWMAVIAAVVVAQKLLAVRRSIDVVVALALVALGAVIVVAPSAIPGLVPSISAMPSM
ncbi:MAG TPA: DUF2182 domain-containing protein [Jatrophihabitantaceae bacterium]|nr:DUF2182 domain-containing protein [Jatrophihabitantaceae bacterium]